MSVCHSGTQGEEARSGIPIADTIKPVTTHAITFAAAPRTTIPQPQNKIRSDPSKRRNDIIGLLDYHRDGSAARLVDPPRARVLLGRTSWLGSRWPGTPTRVLALEGVNEWTSSA